MADKAPALQDQFLNACRRAKAPVTIFLVKGVKLGGVITWFDAFSLLLRREGATQLVYKHSISTILPMRPIERSVLTAPAGKSLQDLFLAAAEREAEAMTLFLVNGVMLQGIVTGHDPFVLTLSRGDEHQMVYKHAISTLQPANPLPLGGDEGDAS